MASIPDLLKYQANLAGVPDGPFRAGNFAWYQANLAGVPEVLKYQANLAGVPDGPFRGWELCLVLGQLGRRP